MKFGVQCLIGKVHLSVSVKKQTEHLIVCMHDHCRQRAPIENVLIIFLFWQHFIHS
jgi:hypothetical protein